MNEEVQEPKISQTHRPFPQIKKKQNSASPSQDHTQGSKTERGSGSPWKAKPPSLATDIREVLTSSFSSMCAWMRTGRPTQSPINPKP